MLHEDQLARNFERFGGRAGHQIEPIGVLCCGTVVWAGEFGDVERVFVAVDDEGHVRDVAFVQAITSYAALGGPAAEVASAIAEPVGEFFGLARGGGLQAAEGGGVLCETRLLSRSPCLLFARVRTRFAREREPDRST